MADEGKLEIPSLNTAYLTIVDIFGALVPGLAWLTLLLILIHFLLVGNVDLRQEYENVVQLFKDSSSVFQSAVLVTYVAVGLTVGYIVKAFAMELAGSIEAFFHGLIIWARSYTGKEYKFADKIAGMKPLKRYRYIKAELRFPYPLLHEGEEYFTRLERIVKKHSDLESSRLPKTRAFSYCKRLIKVSSPELWEESLQMEAEVRMMGSLFLASFLGFLITLVAAITEREPGAFYSRLTLITIVLISISGYAFSRRRREEVRYTYMNVILLNGKYNWVAFDGPPPNKSHEPIAPAQNNLTHMTPPEIPSDNAPRVK